MPLLSRPDVLGSLLGVAVLGVTALAYVRLRKDFEAGQRRIIKAVGRIENHVMDAVADLSSAAHSLGVATGRQESAEPQAGEARG